MVGPTSIARSSSKLFQRQWTISSLQYETLIGTSGFVLAFFYPAVGLVGVEPGTVMKNVRIQLLLKQLGKEFPEATEARLLTAIRFVDFQVSEEVTFNEYRERIRVFLSRMDEDP